MLLVLDAALLFPEHTLKVAKTLDAMPEWVVGMCVGMFGFYFAAAKLSDHGAAIIKAWINRKKGTK